MIELAQKINLPPYGDIEGPLPTLAATGKPSFTDLGSLITGLLDVAFLLATFLAFYWLIWGAFQYLYAGGDKEALGKARGRIISAVVGLLMIAIAFAISQYVEQILQPGEGKMKSPISFSLVSTASAAGGCNQDPDLLKKLHRCLDLVVPARKCAGGFFCDNSSENFCMNGDVALEKNIFCTAGTIGAIVPLPTPTPLPTQTPAPTPIHSIDKPLKDTYDFGYIKSLGQGTNLLVAPVFAIATISVIIYFLIGAFKFITSAGDKGAVGQARDMITHAVIGFLLLMFIFLILQFIPQFFGFNFKVFE